MDNYIVRIYRRGKSNSRMLVGTVEEVGASVKKAFDSYDDLWDILNPQKVGEAPEQGEKKVPNLVNTDER